MKILRISPPRGKLGHQRVVLEGGAALRVRPEDIATLGIEAGADIDDLALDALRARGEGARAEEIAVRLLAVRMRTRRELAGRLRQRGISASTVEAILAKLEQAGFLDDRRFAEAWVRGRIAVHPSGAGRLRQELLGKGVAKDVIERTLKDTLTPSDERDLALHVARSRARQYRGYPPEVAFRRLAGVLQRRGFSSSVVTQVLREVLGHLPSAVE